MKVKSTQTSFAPTDSLISFPSSVLFGKPRKLEEKKSSKIISTQASLAPTESLISIPSSVLSGKPSGFPSLEPSLQPSACMDEEDWKVGGNAVYAEMTCNDIQTDIEGWCDFLEDLYSTTFTRKSIKEACCDCGGGAHTTRIPSSTPSSLPSGSNVPTFPTAAPTSCKDEPGWTFTNERGYKLGCKALEANPGSLCATVESIEFEAKSASFACCVSDLLLQNQLCITFLSSI